MCMEMQVKSAHYHLQSHQTHLVLFKHYNVVQFMKLLKVQAIFLCSYLL